VSSVDLAGFFSRLPVCLRSRRDGFFTYSLAASPADFFSRQLLHLPTSSPATQANRPVASQIGEMAVQANRPAASQIGKKAGE
jgi:hypothetical protein